MFVALTQARSLHLALAQRPLEPSDLQKPVRPHVILAFGPCVMGKELVQQGITRLKLGQEMKGGATCNSSTGALCHVKPYTYPSPTPCECGDASQLSKAYCRTHLLVCKPFQGHNPELILNNFVTRLGRRLARQFAALFPQRSGTWD